jgi:hypothetical protein
MFRFTIRHIMIAIALVAILLGYWVWKGRMERISRFYSQESRFHVSEKFIVDGQAFDERLIAEKYERMAVAAMSRGDEAKAKQLRELGVKSRKRLDSLNWLSRYHETLAWKYLRAESRPWSPLEPDPPPPVVPGP